MWCSVDYQIEVPADIDLDINADDDRVEVVDVRGALTIDDDNGSIEIRGAVGPLRADDRQRQHPRDRHPLGDGLRRQRQRFGRDRDGHATAGVGGNVPTTAASTVVLPDTPDAYAVDADTDNGSVRNDVRTDPASARTITLSSDNGNVTLRYPD